MKHRSREERKQKVIGIWEAKYPDVTVAGVAKQVGLSDRTVYRYLSEAGQPLPPKRKKAGTRKIDRSKVRRAHALYSEHRNKAKVARIMVMSAKQIGRYLKMSVEES